MKFHLSSRRKSEESKTSRLFHMPFDLCFLEDADELPVAKAAPPRQRQHHGTTTHSLRSFRQNTPVALPRITLTLPPRLHRKEKAASQDGPEPSSA